MYMWAHVISLSHVTPVLPLNPFGVALVEPAVRGGDVRKGIDSFTRKELKERLG